MNRINLTEKTHATTLSGRKVMTKWISQTKVFDSRVVTDCQDRYKLHAQEPLGVLRGKGTVHILRIGGKLNFPFSFILNPLIIISL